MFSNMSKQDIINLFSRIGIKIDNANITKGQLLEWAREKILENAVARSDLSIKKYFQSYYAASGGQILAFCAHGIIYGAKFLIGSEGSRDVLDLLLSFKKFPIVTLYDDAGNLAAHAKASLPPEQFPWPKYDGRVAESLDSLAEGTVIPSEEHRVLLYDVFHQPNHKNTSDKLRNLKFVADAKRINSQVAEQSNSEDLPRTAYRNNMLPDLYVADSMICYSRRNMDKSRNLARLISEGNSNESPEMLPLKDHEKFSSFQPLNQYLKSLFGTPILLYTLTPDRTNRSTAKRAMAICEWTLRHMAPDDPKIPQVNHWLTIIRNFFLITEEDMAKLAKMDTSTWEGTQYERFLYPTYVDHGIFADPGYFPDIYLDNYVYISNSDDE